MATSMLRNACVRLARERLPVAKTTVVAATASRRVDYEPHIGDQIRNEPLISSNTRALLIPGMTNVQIRQFSTDGTGSTTTSSTSSSDEDTAATNPTASGAGTNATAEAANESQEFLDTDAFLKEISHQIERKDDVTVDEEDTYHKAHINATYNNTIVTVATHTGDALTGVSCGMVGFKGARRSTAFAAQATGQTAAERAVEKGVSKVRVIVKGLGQGRAAAVKGLQLGGLAILSITDATPVPHNGCRPKKARRL